MARTPDFIQTNTFVPVKGARVETIHGTRIVLADVMYVGPVVDQTALAALEAELAELRRGSTPRTRSGAEYRAALDGIRSTLCALRRVEVWRREYKVLSR